MRILITGSREWTDWNALNNVLSEYLNESDLVIVHGDCPTGADWMAKRWCKFKGVLEEPHPANWKQFGKQAGPIRNQEMVDLDADKCVAFPLPQSRGTFDCMNKARRAGIPVRVVEPGERRADTPRWTPVTGSPRPSVGDRDYGLGV